MTIDELTDEAYLAQLDPELGKLIVEWADWPCWRTIRAVHDWVFAQYEQALDRDELDILEVQTFLRMIRNYAWWLAERHPNLEVRKWGKELGDEVFRQQGHHRELARQRLARMG
jgi:hypothetical protein